MDRSGHALGAFLRARRGLVRPQDVGVVPGAGRRVEGLRRAEVAELAGISPEYYLRLEQGRGHLPSAPVLRGLARALHLDDEALGHMHRLALGSFPGPPVRRVDPTVRSMLDALAAVPAIVIDANQDVLASNRLARALGGGALDPGENLVLQTFGDHRRTSPEQWPEAARAVVADLRSRAAPDDPRLLEIVATLSASDPDFPAVWARHDVGALRAGTARYTVDPIGWIDLSWHHLELPGTAQRLTTFSAEPGSRAAAALSYLAVVAGAVPVVPAA